jgi:hypothetical protein
MLKVSVAVRLLPYFMACIRTTLPLPLPQSKYKLGTFTEKQQTTRLLQLLLRVLKQTCVADSVFPCAIQKTRMEESKHIFKILLKIS